MKNYCCDERRRNAVKNHPFLNGIEFLEIADDPADDVADRQTTLYVHFVKELAPGTITKDNIRIEGGERIKNIEVVEVAIGYQESPPASPLSPPPGPDPQKVLLVKVKEAGDFSPYILRLVKDHKTSEQPDGFDPILSLITFSFKVLCPNDFDCKPACDCGPEPVTQPEINYLAKDYASFRQLMLDRMAVTMPQWKERNPADLGIMLVEALAYAADYLSYRQDAVATEAYLGTARKRISIKRHARLVDYYMHDGCNARTWVHIDIADDFPGAVTIQKKIDDSITTRFITKSFSEFPAAFRPDSNLFEKALAEGVSVFEPMHDEELRRQHNRINFYTWGDRECCLPKGATQAALSGDLSTLKPGQVLIFMEAKGPQTGNPADADPAHRHAVRLTAIELTHDPLFAELSSPASPLSSGIPVTLITWREEDALPFPLCLSSLNDTTYHDNVSVALGNNLLADHGMTLENDPSLQPDTVGESVLSSVSASSGCGCEKEPPVPVAPKFSPVLKRTPLTNAAPYDPSGAARDAMKWSLRDTLPSVILIENETKEKWFPQKDLLGSAANAREFVVEIESDGVAHIRFGDDILGMRPLSGTQFVATYRIGNGIAGNIGRETIAGIVSNDPGITGGTEKIAAVTNPLAATGGTEPETIELVKQKAPAAFRIQERAVTTGDYEDMSLRTSEDIQRSACTFRWTGSWHTAFLTIDRFGGREVSPDFRNHVKSSMDIYRMAGQDVEVNEPQYVSLELEMIVCVEQNYFASDVKAALLKVFSNRVLPDGSLGIFHPDNFSFGQTVYLSPLYAAAQSVPGVASVQITKFKRLDTADNSAVDTGKLPVSRLEIARLDNDPNFPDHGIFNLIMKGGK
ncbi:MAG: putative baseplate assembly protein [Chitinophagaceae bacterium]|nr:putative baseplate assembly protein [Chitinophagaceae bacterium]MCW5926530.1 putative baseplate assembly protein [Chitinophagaceae bacterium]